MSRPVSRPAIITALLRKELKVYSRDKLYLFLTVLTLIAVVALFQFLPDSVDEDITLAVSPPVSQMIDDAKDTLRAMGATDEQLAEIDAADLAQQEEGLQLLEFEDEEEMTKVIDGSLEAWRTDTGELVLRDKEAGEDRPEDAERVDITTGIAFPEGFITDVAAGKDGVSVTVYSDADVPDEIQRAMRSFVREAAYQIAGRELPVGVPDEQSMVLGEDRAGSQVTLREKFRPMIIFLVLLMETFSLASLVSVEVLQRTVTAIMVTPARLSDFLAAKTIFGTLMALGQGLIIALIIGGLTPGNWSLVLAVLIMGSIMFTAGALWVGAAGKDFLGQLFYAMAFTVPMIIPSFSVLFPGTTASWVKVIPTYPIIDVLVGAMNYGETWSDSWRSLIYAAAWLVVLFAAGLIALKRKVESL